MDETMNDWEPDELVDDYLDRLLDNAEELRLQGVFDMEYNINKDFLDRFSALDIETAQKFLRNVRLCAIASLYLDLYIVQSLEPLQKCALQGVLKSMPNVRKAHLRFNIHADSSVMVLQKLLKLTHLGLSVHDEMEYVERFEALAGALQQLHLLEMLVCHIPCRFERVLLPALHKIASLKFVELEYREQSDTQGLAEFLGTESPMTVHIDTFCPDESNKFNSLVKAFVGARVGS
jgi:hypothetical protein